MIGANFIPLAEQAVKENRSHIGGANKNRRKSHYPWTKDGGQVTRPGLTYIVSHK